MRKKIFISLIGLFLSLILSAHAFSLTLYDDFSGTYIDRTKWIYGELIREIREIEQGNYKLILKQASPNPIVAASYPYYENNSLIFIAHGGMVMDIMIKHQTNISVHLSVKN